MTDPFVDQLNVRLRRLARQAVTLPDVDAVRSASPRLLRPAPMPQPRRRPRRYLVAAAILLGLSGVGWLASHVDGSSSSKLVTATPSNTTSCMVFLVPTITPAEAEAIGHRLRERPDTFNLRYIDQQAAYRELKEQMAGGPEAVATITPDMLPPSWRFSTTAEPGAAKDELAATFTEQAIFQVNCAAPNAATVTTPAVSLDPAPSGVEPLPTIRGTATGPSR